MSNGISPLDRARYPDNILDRLAELEAFVAGLQGTNVQAQSLLEVAPDVWGLNTSFPSICQGRLTLTSGTPVPTSTASGDTIYFTPYIGNLIGMYNGSSSTWRQIPFSELSLPIRAAQNGTTTNASAIVTGLTDTSQMVVGMNMTGAGIPASATILTIDSDTQVTMSIAATASATVSISFWVPSLTAFDVFIMDTGNGQLALRMVLWATGGRGLVSGVTNANPPVVTTLSPHGLSVTDMVWIENVVGATGVNDNIFRLSAVAASTFTLKTVDNLNPGAPGAYVSGGRYLRVNSYSNAGSGQFVRTSALALQDGIYVLATDPTWRYLGSAVTQPYDNGVSSRKAVLDQLTFRGLWNYYNRKQRLGLFTTGDASWSPATTAWEADNDDVSYRIAFMVGILEDEIIVMKKDTVSVVSSANAQAGIAWDTLDTTNGPSLVGQSINANAAAIRTDLVSMMSLSFSGITDPGYHAIIGMEKASSTTNATWIGAANYQMYAYIWN